MATKSVIDSKIKRGSTTYTNIVAGGNRVYRVVAGGNLSYDRKDYEFTASGSISIPVTGTSNVKSLVASKVTSKFTGYTSNTTKVVGGDADYAVSPASVSSNAHSTASTSGSITIVQENSSLSGTVSYTQAGDSYEDVSVCTGLTVTLTNVAVIPAAGGTVNSATTTVVANGYVRHDWQSGGSTTGGTTSWTLTSSEYTLAWTGVTVNSKGTNPSNQTTAGTLYCKATYKANTSIKGNASATVYQQENRVTGYTSWEYEMSVSHNVSGTYTAAGGVVTITYGSQRKRKGIYTSTATATTYEYANIESDLTSTVGTLGTNAVSGTGTTTLTVPANTNSLRTITIKVAYMDDASKSASTSFQQYASTSSLAYAYLSNYTGNGIITTWADVNDVRKEITNWNSPTQNVYEVSADGNTVYRLGTNASATPVARDTYFYKHSGDTILFYTRDVSTAGTAGNERLWYKNPAWNFIKTGGGTTIGADTTSFGLSGTTNTKYYVTVKRGTTTVMSKTLYTGGTLTVNCGANTGTSVRTFTVSFEEYYTSAGNKPTMSNMTITQSVPVTERTFRINDAGSGRYVYIITDYGRSGSRHPLQIDHYSTIYDANQNYTFSNSNDLVFTQLNDIDEDSCQTGTTYYVWQWDTSNEEWNTTSSGVKSFTYRYTSDITLTF